MEDKEERIYSVYKHIFPNNKVYIGMTKRKVEDRWGKNGVNYSGQTVFNAIMKYGWINIRHEVLAEKLSLEEAKQMEYDMIKEYNADNKEFGYNEAMGGNYTMCKNHFKAVCMYDLNGNLIKTFESIIDAEMETDSVDIWGAVKGRKKIVNGYVWRYENDPFDKYPITYKNNSRVVCQYDVQGNLINTYSSVVQATKETGSQRISDCCNGKSKMSNGFVWRFEGDDFHKYDDIYNYEIETVVQYDRKGNYIAEYKLRDAKKIFGDDIVSCLNGRAKTARDYVWRYKCDEFDKYPVYDNSKHKLPICQFDLNGNLLHIFKTPNDIKLDNIVNFNWSSIRRCLNGERKTAYGYIWKRKEDDT